jgi:hypothetical protein
MAKAASTTESPKQPRTRRSPADRAQSDLDKSQSVLDKAIKRRDKAEAEYQAARDEVFRAQRFLDYAKANPDLPVQEPDEDQSVIEPGDDAVDDTETRELSRAAV